MHHLSISPGVKLDKQKLRKMHLHVALLVKVELKKILSANFIRAIDYAEWIFNIVPMSKHEKSIQVYTNFRDLNKACPKDKFPLPNIEMIVDKVVLFANICQLAIFRIFWLVIWLRYFKSLNNLFC